MEGFIIMNGKKILRKQIAFISAISFLSANIGPMASMAADTTTTTVSTAVSTTPDTTTETTAPVEQAEWFKTYVELQYFSDRDDYKKDEAMNSYGGDVCNEIRKALNNKGIENNVNFNKGNDNKYKIEIQYKTLKSMKDDLISDVLSSIKCYKELGDSLFVTTIDASNLKTSAKEYYYAEGDEKHFQGKKLLKKGENVVEWNSKQFILKDTELTKDMFNLNKGYCLDEINGGNKIIASGKINIFQRTDRKSVVVVGGNNVYDIARTSFTVKFKSKNVKVEIDKNDYSNSEIKCNWLEKDQKNITFSFNEQGKYKNVIKINNNCFNISTKNNYTLTELINLAGFEDENINWTENIELPIEIEAIPNSVNANINYNCIDESNNFSEEIHFDVEEEENKYTMHIPYIVEKNGKSFYLSYTQCVNGGEDGTKDCYSINEIINNLLAKDKPDYSAIEFKDTSLVNVEYKEMTDENEMTSSVVKTIKNAVGEQRNENVVSTAESDIFVQFNEIISEQNLTFICVNESGVNLAISVNDKGKLIISKPINDDIDENDDTEILNSSSYLKFLFMYRDDGKIVPISMPQFVIYFDTNAPDTSFVTKDANGKVTLKETEEKPVWSNNECKFTINVADKEEYKNSDKKEVIEALDEINQIGNLEYISEINVAGTAFLKPEGGWKSEKEYSAENSDYIIKLIPQLDEKNELNGNFDVVVSLADDSKKSINETIDIYAVDNSYCGGEYYRLQSSDADNEAVTDTVAESKAEIVNTVDDTENELTSYLDEKKSLSEASELDTDAVAESTVESFKSELIAHIDENKVANTGNAIKKTIMIDRAAPMLKSLTVENLINGTQLMCDKNLVVKAEATDNYTEDESDDVSGIKKVSYTFNGDTNDNGEFNVSQNDCNGIIKILVEDNAGNKAEYYYCANAENLVTDDINLATVIGVDKIKPECKIAELSDEDKSDWINHYPTINFDVCDNGECASGIDKINIVINSVSKDVLLADIDKKGIKSGSFYIKFEADADDSSVFIPYLYCKDDETVKVKIADADDKTQSLKDSKGTLNVKIKAYDVAGSPSDDAGIGFRIDNTPPVVSGEFKKYEENLGNGWGNFGKMAEKSFGSFAKEEVWISVDVNDSENNEASSGFEKAVLYFTPIDGLRIPIDMKWFKDPDASSTYALFKIPEKLNANSAYAGKLSMIAYDKAGNQSKEVLLSSSQGKSDVVIIENIKPDIDDPEIVGDNLYKKEVDGKTQLWYSSDVDVTYNFKDNDSGIEFADIKNNNNDELNKTPDFSEIKKETSLLAGTELSKNSDGKFTFEAYVRDNAGNENSKSVEVYKDVEKPYVDGFYFKEYYGNKELANRFAQRFGHFYNDYVDMKVAVKDNRGASAGVKNIVVQLYNTDGSLKDEKNFSGGNINYDAASDTYYVNYPVEEGFKGDIKAWAVDNVMNKSEEGSPDGFVSENDSRHKATSDIQIKLPDTQHSDSDGLPLYANDVKAEINVSDAYSGIKKIEWMTADMDSPSTIEINENQIYGDAEGWNIKTSERNITVSVNKEITVSKDANNNFIKVKMWDNSGNVSEIEEHFSIDKKVPVIEVSGISPSNETQYFNTHKNIQVSVAERNFDSPEVNGSIDSGYADNTNTPKYSDDHKHSKEYSFNSDGSYNVNISDTDRAGNKSAEFASGTFVIDTVAPKASIAVVSENGNIIDTEKNPYVGGSVRASVNIDELNFNPDTVEIKINDEKYTASWTGSSNMHTASIASSVISNDGSYTITVSGKDRAGNELKPVTVSFTVDKKKPEISINGVKKANKDNVEPVINIYDDNLSNESVKVYRNGKICDVSVDSNGNTVKYDVSSKGDYIVGKWSTENLDKNVKKKLVFENFPKEEIYDASYKIEVATEDKAENTSSSNVEFSVNRFGSVFSIDNADELEGKYLNKAPKVIITERNVDMHDEKSEIIIIIDKGTQTVQLSENEYEVSEPVRLKDNSGYEYKYTIVPENFDQDLDYSISIQSVDAAGNTNVSTARGAEVSFTLDTHVPEFKCDDLVDKAEFKGSERQFRLNVNEKLSHIKVTTSLKEKLVDKDVDGDENSFVFTVPASNSSREIIVELTDLAGNKTVKKYDNLLVTENVVLYALHKTWVKVTGISALAGLGAAGGFLFARKKRKNR